MVMTSQPDAGASVPATEEPWHSRGTDVAQSWHHQPWHSRGTVVAQSWHRRGTTSRGTVPWLHGWHSHALPASSHGDVRLQVDNDGTAVPITAANGGDSSDDEDDDGDDMDVDEGTAGPGAMAAGGAEAPQRQPPQPQAPAIDEDGFQMVQRARRRR